jgi:hypothetical protein
MKLTSNRDNQITTNHIAACFNTLVQDFTLDSSPAAVSIWNHPHRQSINAINHNIHNTRFIVVFIVLINLGSCHVGSTWLWSVHITSTQSIYHNHAAENHISSSVACV